MCVCVCVCVCKEAFWWSHGSIWSELARKFPMEMFNFAVSVQRAASSGGGGNYPEPPGLASRSLDVNTARPVRSNWRFHQHAIEKRRFLIIWNELAFNGIFQRWFPPPRWRLQRHLATNRRKQIYKHEISLFSWVNRRRFMPLWRQKLNRIKQQRAKGKKKENGVLPSSGETRHQLLRWSEMVIDRFHGKKRR